MNEYFVLPAFLRELQADPLLRRLIVIAVYGLFAKAVDLFVNRIIKRIAASFTSTQLDDKIIGILHAPIVLSVILLGVLHAITMPPVLESPWNHFLPAAAKSAGPDSLDRCRPASFRGDRRAFPQECP